MSTGSCSSPFSSARRLPAPPGSSSGSTTIIRASSSAIPQAFEPSPRRCSAASATFLRYAGRLADRAHRVTRRPVSPSALDRRDHLLDTGDRAGPPTDGPARPSGADDILRNEYGRNSTRTIATRGSGARRLERDHADHQGTAAGYGRAARLHRRATRAWHPLSPDRRQRG